MNAGFCTFVFPHAITSFPCFPSWSHWVGTKRNNQKGQMLLKVIYLCSHSTTTPAKQRMLIERVSLKRQYSKLSCLCCVKTRLVMLSQVFLKLFILNVNKQTNKWMVLYFCPFSGTKTITDNHKYDWSSYLITKAGVQMWPVLQHHRKFNIRNLNVIELNRISFIHPQWGNFNKQLNVTELPIVYSLVSQFAGRFFWFERQLASQFKGTLPP